MLVDVSARDLGTTVLGEPVSMPILIAPTALHGLAHPEGEVATTKAPGAAKHGARQLDTTPATISVLPEIVDAAMGKPKTKEWILRPTE
jgi:isopentenyl diphosphate isomerase/L-lactate dehydrogenase-like FMN-dependent dehydrogenase